jgi:sigma-B regulation protein RsbU (phosphoserine phosphatase)
MACLIRKDKDGKIQRCGLDGRLTIIGRSWEKCQFVIDDDRVSRIHARIWQENDMYWIEDRESRNRTILNGEDIRGKGKRALANGDVFVICDLRIEFFKEDPDQVEEEITSTIEIQSSQDSKNILEMQPAEKLALLLEIMTELTTTMNVDDLWPLIAGQLLRVFQQADRVLLFADEKEIESRCPRVLRSRQEEDRKAARFSRGIVRNCLKTGNAFLCEDLKGARPKNVTEESVAQSQIRSVLCAALKGRAEHPHGVIQLDTQDAKRKFTRTDLDFLVAVAGQMALTLENAARAGLERDLQTARQIQRGFLPGANPRLPSYQFERLNLSAQEVGGDYYDFITLPDGRVAVLLGDASGKGIPAALLMARFSAAAQNAILSEPSLARAVAKLNQQVSDMKRSDNFITLVATLIDPHAHTITYVNAGHPPPIHFRNASGSRDFAFSTDRSGFPLGMFEDAAYQEYSMPLAPGDSLLLYSDGVPDMRNQTHSFGTAGIFHALSHGPWTPTGLVNALMKAVQNHGQGYPQTDDLTLVCFGRTDS